MKKILLFTIILILSVGIAYAKDYEVTKKAGPYTVQVRMDRNPPSVGNNNATIAIKDAQGQGVIDAAVAVEYGMPAMPGMGAMNYKQKATLKDGQYRAALNLSMSGSWYVTVKITKSGKTQSIKLNVDVQ